jgi:hypothetical protein
MRQHEKLRIMPEFEKIFWFNVVTLPLSIYKSVVAEIVRWNQTLRTVSWGDNQFQPA